MQVRGPNRVQGPAPAIKKGKARATEVTDSSAEREVASTVSLAGIPEVELTPRVRSAMVALLGEVGRLRKELEDSRARISNLERLADEDPLTPIANRRAFVRELSRMIGFSERYGSPASVIYFDVNGMKAVNDTHGHAAGDAVLLNVSRVLLENVRSSDVVGRLGGDEFGVILAQNDQDQASRKAETLASAIAASPVPWEGTELSVTVSYGVHSFAGGEDPDQAMRSADQAMYEEKKRRRSQPEQDPAQPGQDPA